MAKHFNKLTAAEAERLALLLEEMGEALQAIGKIQRHGYESYHPKDPNGPLNRERLEKELADVRFAIDLLCTAGDVNRVQITHFVRKKIGTVKPYIHHQPKGLMAKVEKAWSI